MTKNDERSSLLCEKKPWNQNENSIWLASTLTLRRNIEKFKFPTKLDAGRHKQIVSLLSKDLLTADCLKQPKLYPADEFGPLEREFLVEHFLSTQSFHEAHSGEAFILDESGTFLAVFNLKDHLFLQLTDCSGEIEATWNKLMKMETSLGKSIAYSFSQKFGFLTSDPALCGTAFVATAFLQLPALIHLDRIEDVLEKVVDDSLAITGIQGNPTEIIGDILAIQNNYTIGTTEETILSTLRNTITKLILAENSARHDIRHKEHPEIKDMVSRAYGILIHSYQIDAIEALNAISIIKLGSEMGWITGINNRLLNELFFNCRYSHLICQYRENIEQEAIPHKRAEFIHQTLKNAQLII